MSELDDVFEGMTEEEKEEFLAEEDEAQCWLRESELVRIDEVGGGKVYLIRVQGNGIEEVGEEEWRIVDQYEAAKRRQAEAEALCERRWIKLPDPLDEEDEDSELEPEAIPPAGKLTPRQALFCEHYAAQPVAARAAVLAGYGEDNANNQGYRLLKNPLVLTRIAALRAERDLHYVIEADTVQDKLEAVFFEALDARNHAAAVAALRLQAGLARLPTRAAAPSGVAQADDAKRAGAKGENAAPKRRRATREADKSRSPRRKMTTKADQ